MVPGVADLSETEPHAADPSPAGTAPVTTVLTGSGGLPLAVQDHGGADDAPTVLLVHGYPDDHHVWDLVVPHLLADHRVVTFDVRGAGDSAAPADRSGYRLEHLVADIAIVIAAVSPDRPVHLVGHDWGSIQCWSAVLDADVAARIASYTSMSGPSLEHIARWIAARRRPGAGRWSAAARQAFRSWYIYAFHTPLAPLAWRSGLTRRWPELLRRGDDVRIDESWPGPLLERNAVNGIELYRANMLPALRGSTAAPTPVPVRLIIARRDPFVTPALLEGIEEIAPNLIRRELEVGHWAPRSDPDVIAHEIREQVARTEAATAEIRPDAPVGPAET